MMTFEAFWAAALALSLLLYVVLDGFDLGVGILFGFTSDETERREMMSAISPVWDGNETWLVLAAATLFAAFPLVYSVLLSAFYLPLCVMLVALILRGVAFEFRHNAGPGMRRVWDAGFAGGSLVATFIQGVTAGALVYGIPVTDGRYAGSGPFDWFSPFAVLCGIGLVLGYSLLGAAWLVLKGEREVRDKAYRRLPWLVGGALVFIALAFFGALGMELRVMHRWIDRPWLVVFPLIGIAAVGTLLAGVRKRRDAWPFASAAVLFGAAFAMLAASFLPYMVPFSITIAEAAAPPSSLSFFFWGAGAFVLPLILVYTIVVYTVFKGKVRANTGYH